MKITVLGDGAWGTTLALLLCGNGHEVNLWGPFKDNVDEMREHMENRRFLRGIPLSDRLGLHDDILPAVENSEMIVLASPAQYMRSTLEKFSACTGASGRIFVNIAKGIENDTLKRMSELCAEFLGPCSYVVLSGPSHAEEVARSLPAAVVAASESQEAAQKAQSAFMNKYFRVYTTGDVVSVELGGALKNVLAIAAGVIDGMGTGDNSKAAMITRGIAEMSRLGVVLGGKIRTFSGLSGVGDLIVTCASRHSRNRHVGEALGRGQKLDAVLDEMGQVVAEGIKTARSARDLAAANNVEVPIINEVYSVLYEGKDPRQAMYDLMTRRARSEFD